jgi:hypothetical protein
MTQLTGVNKMSEIKTVPVFTQEMSDNGVIPTIGMEFMCGDGIDRDSRISDFIGEKVKVIGISDLRDKKVITFSHSKKGIACGCFLKSWVKPFPEPIELIDGAAYMFDVIENTFLGFYRESRKSFFYEIINGNKIAGASEATNIRLMTVESK